jgi:porphobilinogen synthase
VAFGSSAECLRLTYNRSMSFPVNRMRRLRRTESLRALVREMTLNAGDLIYPLFLCPGEGVRKPVGSMPGVFNLSVDEAVKEAEEAAALGVGGLLLFGLPESKDEQGTGAWDANGIVQQGLRALKSSSAAKKLVLIADVCLCEYTSHGHCGLIHETGSEEGAGWEVDNDPSVALLAKTAASLAEAGADIVAPSDMMDGRVAAIRAALDAAGRPQTPILSYASKFASAFYGPFREAADSAPQFGDRRSYQMDGANLREAMREIELDLGEGADMILMKPAMPYLDVVRAARERFGVPIGAYQVSGEYSMLHAAFEKGWLDRDRAMMESLVGIKRAGADFIVTYFAKDAAKLV